MSHPSVHPHFFHATRSPLKKKSPRISQTYGDFKDCTQLDFILKCLLGGMPRSPGNSPLSRRSKGKAPFHSMLHAYGKDRPRWALHKVCPDTGASHSLDGRVPFSSRQVFWLTDQPTHHPFPARSTPCQWSSWLSSPFTAAGPRRSFTVFPFKPSVHQVPGTILCQRADDTSHHL